MKIVLSEEHCSSLGFGALFTASISGIFFFVDQRLSPCVCVFVEQSVRACVCVLITTCSLRTNCNNPKHVFHCCGRDTHERLGQSTYAPPRTHYGCRLDHKPLVLLTLAPVSFSLLSLSPFLYLVHLLFLLSVWLHDERQTSSLRTLIFITPYSSRSMCSNADTPTLAKWASTYKNIHGSMQKIFLKDYHWTPVSGFTMQFTHKHSTSSFQSADRVMSPWRE